MQYALNVWPTPTALGDLRDAVGYGRAEADYPRAFEKYSSVATAHDASGRLVGWCSAVSDGVRHAFIVDILTLPDLQRRGVGRELLRRVVRAEFQAGVSIIHADFAPAAAGFYERCGFRCGLAGILEASLDGS